MWSYGIQTCNSAPADLEEWTVVGDFVAFKAEIESQMKTFWAILRGTNYSRMELGYIRTVDLKYLDRSAHTHRATSHLSL